MMYKQANQTLIAIARPRRCVRALLLAAVSALVFASCAEGSININCGGANNDFSCPGQPTDMVGDARVSSGASNSEIILSWTNPSQGDLSRIDIRWSTRAADVQEEAVVIVARASLNEATIIKAGETTGMIRLTGVEPGQAMMHAITGITNGKTYRFAISATDREGNIATVKDIYHITPPIRLAAISEGTRAMLTWERVLGATEYYIYKAAGGNQAIRIAMSAAVTDTSFVDSDIVSGSSYNYTVRAVIKDDDKIIESVDSVVATIGIRGLIATPGNEQVTLAWDSVDGAVKYYIYRAPAVGGGVDMRIGMVSADGSGATLTFTDRSVTNNGMRYRYAISTVNASNKESDKSSPPVSTLTFPAVPDNFGATAGSRTVALRWDSVPSATEYHIYRATGGGTHERVATTSSPATTYIDSGPDSSSTYNYTVSAANDSGEGSKSVGVSATTLPLTPIGLAATVISTSSVNLDWTNPDPAADNLNAIRIRWATVASLSTEVGNHTITSPVEGGAITYTVNNLSIHTAYRFQFTAVDTANNQSTAATVDATPSIDGDGDKLIDIHNLDMLNNIRYRLDGIAYKTSNSDTGVKCGGGTEDCVGYELIRSLDFNNVAHYESGSTNTSEWKANNANPDNANNAGWIPLGINKWGHPAFTAIFDGNGHTISNFYVRDTININRIGFFGVIKRPGKVRNLIMRNGNVYGGIGGDWIGIIAGLNESGAAIIASSASGSANGEAGNEDNVGGLVGVNFGEIIASYATSSTTGGAGSTDKAGGLAGYNGGTITASYATGTADGGADGSNRAGGLVGENNRGTITASYATGTADGGAGSGNHAGSLIGQHVSGTITASYGFGSVVNEETAGNSGNAKPGAVTAAYQLTAPGTATSTAAANEWGLASSNTKDVWGFGTQAETPALKYADYDDDGDAYRCSEFPTGACGMLLPGQTLLRSIFLVRSSVTRERIEINWDSVIGAASYRIYRAIGGPTTTRVAYNLTATSYAEHNLKNATSYTYTIQAMNADGEIIRSTPVTAIHAIIPTSWQNDNAVDNNLLFAVNHAGGRWVAVGAGGAIITSTDGTTWTRVSSSPTTELLYSVHHADAGGRWVAVGAGGMIITSTDGTTWTRVSSSPTTEWLYSVRHSGSRWVAVGNSGTIITSTDGTTWTRVSSSPTTNKIDSVHHAGGRWVAVGAGGTIITSGNGTTWTRVSSSPTDAVLYSAHHAGAKWVAVGAGGTIITSGNGTTWMRINSSPTADHIYSIYNAGSRWVAVGNAGTIITSTGSAPWTRVSSRPTTAKIESAHHAGGIWVAVGVGGTIITSTDGTAWNNQISPTTKVLNSVHHAGGIWVAVGNGGTIITSTNSTTWTSISGVPVIGNLNSVHHAGGRWVAVGANGTIITSANGTTWNSRTSGTTKALNSVHHAGGRWVAVGANGIIITSANGTAWNSRTSGTTKVLSSVHHAGGIWVAVGANGTIITSANGTAWNSRTSNTNQYLNSVHYTGGRWIAVGNNGVIITFAP